MPRNKALRARFRAILPPSQPPPPPPPSLALIGGRPGGPESRLLVVVLLFSVLATTTSCRREGGNASRTDARAVSVHEEAATVCKKDSRIWSVRRKFTEVE